MYSVFLFFVLLALSAAVEDQPLPALKDGTVVNGPGHFRQDTALTIRGRVTLENLTLELNAPVTLAEGTTLILDNVQIVVSDPPGAPNGTSRLHCQGPAHLVIRNSTLAPLGGAHPIWELSGSVDVDNFQTENSEFHFNRVQGNLKRLKLFELEISRESQVRAEQLVLVFLSTHSSEHDRLTFENVPSGKPFDREMQLGSGARAELKDTQIQVFLLYIHGAAEATLSNVDRVQLAIFPECSGIFELADGRMGSATKPVVFPDSKSSNCPFRISLRGVNVDTWDVYAGGDAELTLRKSKIDELGANGNARVVVEDSEVYADWMAAGEKAQFVVTRSTVGALSLAGSRPDLATSQIRLGGKSHSVFKQVRFDCGVVAGDDAYVQIVEPAIPPKYVNRSGNAIVERTNAP